MTPSRGKTLEEAFRYHLPGDIGGSGCVEWPGSVGSAGYGKFCFKYKDYNAHRVSYLIYKGEIPAGMLVLHDPARCNNRRCVNPDHLRLGTAAENQHDRNVAGTDVRGQHVVNAKLRDEDVVEIRNLRRAGATEQELAAKYGVHRTSINLIVNRKTWTHV